MNPYLKYKEQSVMTMTPGEMVVRLFEEAIKHLAIARSAINNHKIETANSSLLKSQNIIRHLRSTLNMQYEISNNLAMLYDFFISQIIQSNIKKDTQPIDDIIPMLTELKDSFAQAEKLARID